MSSHQLARMLRENHEIKRSAMRSLVADLDRLANDTRTLVLTCEGLTQSIWRTDADVLKPLQELTQEHAVCIVYYVRPQHTALEAAWRQWGFRTGQRPALYLERRAQQLHYLETWVATRTVAPSVDFVVRPFRSDLLLHGDVAIDFAHHFLGLNEDASLGYAGERSNTGLPLELINLLGRISPEFFGPTPHNNNRFDAIKRLLRGVEAPARPDVLRGQRLLQSWCHDRFEESNRELILRLGWPTESFVPATGDSATDLRAINVLWRSRISPMELQAFLRLLEMQLDGEERHPET